MKLLLTGLFGLSLSQERAGKEMKQWGDVLQYPGEDSYRLLTNKVLLLLTNKVFLFLTNKVTLDTFRLQSQQRLTELE